MLKSTIISFLLIFTASTFAFGQEQIKMYRTKDGTVFTQQENDSIMALGYARQTFRKEVINDTTYLISEFISLAQARSTTAKYSEKPLPPIRLVNPEGKTITNEDLKGKITVINFWSTTCVQCIAEFPQLNRLYKEYKERVVFLAPLPEDEEKTAQLLDRKPFDFPLFPNSSELFENLEIKDYPKFFFVNEQGIIQTVKEGTPRTKNPETGEMEISVYEEYAAILDKMLNAQNN